MDIPNIPSKLIKALEQKNTEQLIALSRVLNLVQGKVVIATVSSVEHVTPQEREQLLKQTAAALTQINKQVINQSNLTPAVKAEISRLMQQQDLIQSPTLKWANIVVNNRPIITYTDRPLTAGQNIPVQMQGAQKLVLLDLSDLEINDLLKITNPTVTNLATKANPVTNTNLDALVKAAIAELKAGVALNITADKNLRALAQTLTELNEQSSVKTVGNQALGQLTEATESKNIISTNSTTYTSTKETTLKAATELFKANTLEHNSATSKIVGESLRNLLPHKDTPNVLYSAVTQWQQLPTTHRQQLVSPTIEQALKSIAEQIRSPNLLTQPKVLAQIIKNSGVFFENKLNHAVQAGASTNAITRTFMQDQKGALLNLVSKINQELTGENKPLSSDQTLKLLQQVSAFTAASPATSGGQPATPKSDAALSIALLMQQLMTKPVKELSDKELRTQLLVLLQQHSVHSLAKIQLQQLHSLNQEIDKKESAQTNASWQVEVPVKHHNDVNPLHLRIDREWVDDKNQQENNGNATKVKQWTVTMRFDLPKLGELCSQFSIIDTNISVVLWAAQEKTFKQVREQMDELRKQLESEGINVRQLQCMKGMPTQKPMALSYSLIDIST